MEPTPYSLLFADSGDTRTTATAYAVGETRPRPSTIYPQQHEPEGEPYGSRFVLKIPEITLTPDLKKRSPAVDAERRQGGGYRVQDWR